MSFRIDKGQFIPVQPEKSKGTSTIAPTNPKFQHLLQESMLRGKEIKISAHAKQRMEERNIHLEEKDLKTLQGAMENLEQKGAQESLILYKEYAFIASVRNRTIITSMSNQELDIITNIDSAISVK